MREKMTKEDFEMRIEALNDIIVELDNLRNEVYDLVHGTQAQAHFEAYAGYGFDHLLGKSHSYNNSLGDLIEGWTEEMEEVEEDNE